MRYSLLSQFQGVLVGAALGELVGTSWEAQSAPASQPDAAAPPQPLINPDRWLQLLTTERFGEQLSTAGCGGRVAVLGAQSLVQRGELDLATWQQHLQSTSQHVPNMDGWETPEMAIATLPIALFFHEDETKLFQRLQQICQLVNSQSSSLLASFMVSWTIAQALRHQFQPQQLIPQLIAAITRLDMAFTSPMIDLDLTAGVMQQLAQVQTWLEQPASLEVVRSQLSQFSQPLQSAAIPHELKQLQPVLSALYCCLATPDDWRLAVLRAVQMKVSPSSVAALTGAIAGAANSLTRIPVTWRLALDQPNGISRLKLLWQGVESESELLELASDLLASWSGTYDTRKFPVKRHQIPAIAAPRVIRPR